MIDLYNNINSDDNIIIEKEQVKNEENKIINDDKSLSDKLNEMTIIYKIDKNQDEIRIFGKHFVDENKDNCILLIDGQEIKLCQYFKLNNKQKNNDTLKVKLIEKKSITNMFCLFSFCESLISLPDIDKWDTKNATNMGHMFSYCTILKSLPDISIWDIRNVTNIGYMFNQ